MYARKRSWILFFMISLTLPVHSFGQGDHGFNGKWQLIKSKSSEIDLYGTLSLEIGLNQDSLSIIQKWGTRRSFVDSLDLLTDGSVNEIATSGRVWPTNVFMGVSMQVGSTRQITARWENQGKALRLEEVATVLASQGAKQIKTIHLLRLSDERGILTYEISRETRNSDKISYVLKRAGSREAYHMQIEDDWSIDGLLPTQALLISLQGVVNSSGPMLYFTYPENWAFTYTPAVLQFYKEKKNYTFRELKSVEQAIGVFKDHVRGYVVWDKQVRTSLIVAFTVSGLERAVVVSEDLIPLVEEAGLKKVEDFRGRFVGKSDAEIYNWAYDQYWPRCSKDFIIWLGGEHGNIMKPGVADFGVYKQVFFNDLSTKKEDIGEFELANRILSQMNPMSMVMGWHSYAKDLERDHVTLVSGYGHRVEGLHTLPNLSFSSHVPAGPRFEYKNRHNVTGKKSYVPKNKVYITCVQTDGLGIGAWLKPGRGEIPYAWEVIMNYSWLAPAMMEFFYSTATANDYFIGALSGPGYIYPKAVPPKLLTPLITEARRLMDLLDLRVFEIMDYSEGATVEGNTELNRRVVDAYFDGMPDAIGFVNGYAPAFTFTARDGRPLISYDYYLSPTRSRDDAVADLRELAKVNSERPYFLLMHIRESSNIKRVKGILDGLGREFELVPLDVFLTMAGKKATFKERFLEDSN